MAWLCSLFKSLVVNEFFPKFIKIQFLIIQSYPFLINEYNKHNYILTISNLTNNSIIVSVVFTITRV